ncbi:ATP-binding protein [Bacillus cytotoxicus]|uniref:ATP-binding protein n=1 Tax=Bacillus cytotoxicus TaxID=580165 RepID=UPI0024476FE1|nr:ATP-binding protein [Bacillus cytotoxicus]MDH2879432.1 ATP-binding protein [Bacillus cytotoxicus]
MVSDDRKIGRIIKIEGLNILIELNETGIANKLILKYGINDFVVSINKLIYSFLPNGKKIVARITQIYDKSSMKKENIFLTKADSFLIEATFLGIYDEFIDVFENGINTFLIIGSEIYSVNQSTYQSVLRINSKYRLQIGTSYQNVGLEIQANPDILFGKHLGVFGNTGTGKSCTVASLIQGLKRRLKDENGKDIQICPKIIIFDSNDEYEQAFSGTEFRTKKISKEQLKLPHYYLNYIEYYKFLGASQGVQAPILKACIDELRNDKGAFCFKDLPDAIRGRLNRTSKKKDADGNPTNEIDNFKLNQWYGWCSTMINRIENIIEDQRIMPIIEFDEQEAEMNIIQEEIDSQEEIILIEADFDKDELDIIMFLFSKLMYKFAIENRSDAKKNNLVVLFEEAHRYTNEDDKHEYKLGNYYIERLAREGRKFGISLIISSQRPSELSKTVLSQCNSYIIHRINNKNDLEFISRCLTTNNHELLKFVSGMEKQYAIIFGEAFGYSDIIKVEKASPTPNSDDPTVIQSWLN